MPLKSNVTNLIHLKAVNVWLTTLKKEDADQRCKEYIHSVFPPANSPGASIAWPQPNKVKQLSEECAGQKMYSTSYKSRYESDRISLTECTRQCGMR